MLPFDLVGKLITYVPGHEVLSITSKQKGKASSVTLAWSAGTGTYDSINPNEYPAMPDLKDPTQGKLDGDSLIPAMLSVLPFASTEDVRPVLHGVTVILGNPVEVAAADGFRLGYQVLPLSYPAERTIILPLGAVGILAHLLKKTPRASPLTDSLVKAITAKRELDVALDDGLLRVSFGAVTAIIRLIQGSPPTFVQLIPTQEPVLKTQLFGPEFEAAVKRVSAIAHEGSGAIRMVFNDGTATISAKAEGTAEVEAVISAMNTQGAPNRLAVNQTYLLNYLKGKDGIITLSMTTPTGPILFQYQQSPKVLIMPMRVEWPGDAKPTAEVPESPAETTTETPAQEAAIVKPRRASRRKTPTEAAG